MTLTTEPDEADYKYEIIKNTIKSTSLDYFNSSTVNLDGNSSSTPIKPLYQDTDRFQLT